MSLKAKIDAIAEGVAYIMQRQLDYKVLALEGYRQSALTDKERVEVCAGVMRDIEVIKGILEGLKG